MRISQVHIILFVGCILTAGLSLDSQSQKPGKEEKKVSPKAKKQEKIDQGKVMIMPLAGPASIW